MLKQPLLICLILILTAATATSQDVRFSQYFTLSSWLNPGLSGQYDGKYRLSAIYRDQWRGTLDESIASFGFGADTQFDVRKKRQYTDKVSVGILLLNDRSRINDFNTNHIDLNGAYHKLLDNASNRYLSLGVSIGITQFGFNYNDVIFGDQFNGIDDYSQPTSELFPPNSVAVGDLSLGLVFSTDIDEDKNFRIGLSAHHFNQPNKSFFNQIEDVNLSFNTNDALPVRIGAFAMSQINMSKTARITPRIVWNRQHTVQEFHAGATYRQLFYTRKNTAVHLGVYASISDHLESTHFNSLTGLIGFEVQNMILGFSYERLMDDLSAFSGFGSFELSISYIGNFEDSGEFCPTF
ncbi:MAG: PorP/SprF family type IX secretion system membrane protein [Saprospiraceae bacterium]|nr:PorP/SprF family type IX secretion system membrane protein [Saprospiraceae bacterium]